MIKFYVLTLFTNMFNEFKNTSIIKRAIDKNKIMIETIDIRDFTKNKHKKVDFPPYGGGSGMIMSCEPIASAIDYAKDILKDDEKEIKIIYMSPRGKLLDYEYSFELSNSNYNYIILCGHYEGIDERIIDEYNITEVSIGNYILTGGELASQVLMDTVVRLLPGVITELSLLEESHTNKLLEYPQYTKPFNFKGRKVPEILISGNHENINKYRKEESIRITNKLRPDLLNKKNDII